MSVRVYVWGCRGVADEIGSLSATEGSSLSHALEDLELAALVRTALLCSPFATTGPEAEIASACLVAVGRLGTSVVEDSQVELRRLSNHLENIVVDAKLAADKESGE